MYELGGKGGGIILRWTWRKDIIGEGGGYFKKGDRLGCSYKRRGETGVRGNPRVTLM